MLDSTNHPNKNTESLIGKILEVKEVDYSHDTLEIYEEDKSDFWVFNFSDVQVLLPKEFTVDGRRLGYGDKIDGCDILGISLNPGGKKLIDIKNPKSESNFVVGVYEYDLKGRSITPLKQTTLEDKECEVEIEGVKYTAKLSIK